MKTRVTGSGEETSGHGSVLGPGKQNTQPQLAPPHTAGWICLIIFNYCPSAQWQKENWCLCVFARLHHSPSAVTPPKGFSTKVLARFLGVDCSAGRQIFPGMSWSPPWVKGAIPDTVQGGTGAAKATVALQECKSLQLNNKSVSITGVTSLQSSGHLKFSTPSFSYLLIEQTLLKSMNLLGNAKTLIPCWNSSSVLQQRETQQIFCHATSS